MSLTVDDSVYRLLWRRTDDNGNPARLMILVPQDAADELAVAASFRGDSSYDEWGQCRERSDSLVLEAAIDAGGQAANLHDRSHFVRYCTQRLDYSYIGGLALRCNYLIMRIVYIFRGMSFHFVGDSAMNAQTACTNQSQHAVPRVAEAHSRLSGNHAGLLANLGFVAILSLTQNDATFAATAPSLGSDSTYAIVSSTYTNSLNAGTETKIIGLGALSPTVCYDTAPSTPPISIFGAITTPCPNINVGLDFNAALANLNAQALLPSCTDLGVGAVNLDAVNLGGGPGVFTPGCYRNGGAMGIVANGIVTLNGPGVYIFKPNGALTTGANSLVTLANGACASDVFWAPTATTLGANAATSPTPTFVGNILDPAGITIGHFANMTGRALAFGVTVTTDATTITVPTCAPFRGSGGSTDIPTLSEWAMVMLAALLALAGFAAMRRRAR